MTRDDLINLYESAIAVSDKAQRKGKANPYTSTNGHMFSQINKDNEIGVRLPKPRQKDLLEQYGAGPFKSYGATMRDYVRLTDEMLDEPGLLTRLLDEGFDFVAAMPPGGKKK